MTIKYTQIHRFGDTVAMYLGEGETVYLTPKQAKEIAKALNACAKDCKDKTYLSGTFSTKEFTLEDTGHNGCKFKIKRSTDQ